jgi:hypothetical protein
MEVGTVRPGRHFTKAIHKKYNAFVLVLKKYLTRFLFMLAKTLCYINKAMWDGYTCEAGARILELIRLPTAAGPVVVLLELFSHGRETLGKLFSSCIVRMNNNIAACEAVNLSHQQI